MALEASEIQPPRVSVIMPVYNAGRFLREAVESVLHQTFQDFEIIAVDDGSSDESLAVLESFGDPRLRIVRIARNLGVIAALNRGLDAARGKFFARMDADDICTPDRLEQQVTYLEQHPEVGVCGTWFRTFGLHDITYRHPVDHDDIVEGLLHVGCVIGHPTVMLRREALGLARYEPAFEHAEDYRLWSQLLATVRFANLPRICLHYRTHDSQVSVVRAANQGATTRRIQAFMAASVCALGDGERRLLESAFIGTERFDKQALVKLRELLARLVVANAHERRYRPARYTRLLATIWARACVQQALDLRTGLRMYPSAKLALLRAWPQVGSFALRGSARRALRLARRTAARLIIRRPVVVAVSGDMANQMFQYSAGFALSKELQTSLAVDVGDFKLFKRHRYSLDSWRIAAPALGVGQIPQICKTQIVRPRNTGGIASITAPAALRRGCYMVGEWRSCNGIARFHSALVDQFRPRAPLTSRQAEVVSALEEKPSIALVLGPAPFVIGTKVDRKRWPPAAPLEFYVAGLARIRQMDSVARVLLFWINRGQFEQEGIQSLVPHDEVDIDESSASDLYMVSRAMHFVIPSCAFAWWAAWLGATRGKQVVAPRQWRRLSTQPSSDLLPPEWHLI
jgi:glycosyltransferase involved in cell wall biosynthesis